MAQKPRESSCLFAILLYTFTSVSLLPAFGERVFRKEKREFTGLCQSNGRDPHFVQQMALHSLKEHTKMLASI